MKQSTEVRQTQIKRAVLDIIHSDGLRNVSTRMLSQRIGISEATIFRHFASKQDIILSIISDVQKDFIGSLRTIANSNIEPEKRLEMFISQTVKYLVDNRGITMVLFSGALNNSDAELKSNLQQIFNSQKNLVSKIFLDGIAIGKWDDSIPVENLAMLYMGFPVSLNIGLILGAGEFCAENICSQMMQMLQKILTK
ncbi:MAG TPA: TetR/AcrR family transcriptional regulator [Williamwhitmania sp.]|nr:TetR/AcrR family transcriptional regulator [Williamwhitmania sp.]